MDVEWVEAQNLEVNDILVIESFNVELGKICMINLLRNSQIEVYYIPADSKFDHPYRTVVFSKDEAVSVKA
jgi:hypothetical protein